MTHFLTSDDNPDGDRLEDILHVIRTDVLKRCLKIADDPRPEARHVLKNNMQVLNLLSEAIALAEESTRTLDKAFGPSVVHTGGQPRIGEA